VQAGALNIVVGSHIWLEDKDLAWIAGEVFRIEGRNAHVRTTNGKTVCVSVWLMSVITYLLQ
jgi:myosin-5